MTAEAQKEANERALAVLVASAWLRLVRARAGCSYQQLSFVYKTQAATASAVATTGVRFSAVAFTAENTLVAHPASDFTFRLAISVPASFRLAASVPASSGTKSSAGRDALDCPCICHTQTPSQQLLQVNIEWSEKQQEVNSQEQGHQDNSQCRCDVRAAAKA